MPITRAWGKANTSSSTLANLDDTAAVLRWLVVTGGHTMPRTIR